MWACQPQQFTAPPSGHFYTSLYSFLPPSISVSLSGVSLCVSVPVGSSAMLNAPLSSLPRQELICEIIYLAVYFRHWEDTLLTAPTLYSIYAGYQAFGATFPLPHPVNYLRTPQAGLNMMMLILIGLNLNPRDPHEDACMTEITSSTTAHKQNKKESRWMMKETEWVNLSIWPPTPSALLCSRKLTFPPRTTTFTHTHTHPKPLGTKCLCLFLVSLMPTTKMCNGGPGVLGWSGEELGKRRSEDGVKSLETFPLSCFVLSLRAGKLFRYVRSVLFFLFSSSLILCFVQEESNCQEH